MKSTFKKFDYDVAISFAGEDRKQAKKLADVLSKRGIAVFYDEYYQSELWGKDLYNHLSKVYREKARYCMILISNAYKEKMWTRHELRSAQERALNEIDNEYILPIRLDETILPGLSQNLSFLDIEQYSFVQIADLFSKKIGYHTDKKNYKKIYELLSLRIHTEAEKYSNVIDFHATAKVAMNYDKYIEESAASEGQNPVDAALKAIQKAINIYPEIIYFRYKSEMNNDFEQIAFFSITVRIGDKIATGTAKDPDVARAAVYALITCLNKIESM